MRQEEVQTAPAMRPLAPRFAASLAGVLHRLADRLGGADANLSSKTRTAEAAARHARDQLREAIEAIPEGIVFLDEEHRYILWNQSYADIYKATADLFVPGRKLIDTLRIGVARGDYPEARGREDEWLAERMALLANPGTRHEQRLADGRVVMIEERRTASGGTIGIRVDITEMKEREATVRMLFESNPVPMFLFDAESFEIRAANDAARDHYRFSASPVGRDARTLFAAEEQLALRAIDWRAPRFDAERTFTHLKADGTAIEVTLLARALRYEDRATVVLAAIDMTERRQAEARIAHMAKHDALTNLPNRVLYREKVEEALARLDLFGEAFAVLLVDLDHFKAVNDTLGHSVGDKLLEDVARRVIACIGPYDSVARLGGDEFAILHPLANGTASAAEVAASLVDVLRQPFEIESHRVVVGASIGIACAPEDGGDAERLLKSADLALYRAKANGRGTFAFFEAAMDEQLQARRAIESELRDAIAADQLTVEYQPLIALADGKVAGYEALLRWHHATRGSIPPSDFIPIAEEAGFIGEIGEMVLNRACRDAVTWPDDVKVAVNLSPAQFKGCRILDVVIKALEGSGLRPGRLELEITEALLMERSDATIATLHALRALGVGISMDDFGTGYSSLSYLRSFPFTKIKIDKSFVRDLSGSSDSQAIVRAIISLGASLGMTVTAEGIERPEDLAYLRGEGCGEGQGFYFSPAVPADTIKRVAMPARSTAA